MSKLASHQLAATIQRLDKERRDKGMRGHIALHESVWKRLVNIATMANPSGKEPEGVKWEKP